MAIQQKTKPQHKKRTLRPVYSIQLAKTSKKLRCPSCGQKSFTSYVYVTDGSSVDASQFGICDRTGKCGYHKAPKSEDLKNLATHIDSNQVAPEFVEREYLNTIEPKYMINTLGKDNNLTDYLTSLFDEGTVRKVLTQYHIGTIDFWNARATIFWQIDCDKDIRTGKIMLYNKEDGKRVRKPYDRIAWAHTPYNKGKFGENVDYSLKQCFFGEHLLDEKIKKYHVVESEKTALLGAIAAPNTVWLATGSIMNISRERLKPFQDYELILYPDKGKAYQLWKDKVEQLSLEFNIRVSDKVENAACLGEGEDIGDLIVHLQKEKLKKTC